MSEPTPTFPWIEALRHLRLLSDTGSFDRYRRWTFIELQKAVNRIYGTGYFRADIATAVKELGIEMGEGSRYGAVSSDLKAALCGEAFEAAMATAAAELAIAAEEQSKRDEANAELLARARAHPRLRLLGPIEK